MKIQKFNEDVNSSKNNANLLAKKLAKKFFTDAEGFDRIFPDYDLDENIFEFYVCFDEIYDTTIEQLGKFNEYMGYGMWSLSTTIFTYSENSVVPCKELVNEILSLMGVSVTCDDIFSLAVSSIRDSSMFTHSSSLLSFITDFVEIKHKKLAIRITKANNCIVVD